MGSSYPGLTGKEDRKKERFSLKEEIWQKIKREALEHASREPILASFFHSTIIKHENLASSLSYILANKLATSIMPAMSVREIIEEALACDQRLAEAATYDICAIVERDPAVNNYSIPLLYLKGYHALQSFRVANWLWQQDRRELAVYLQNQISVACQVDVHPAASIGRGIMFDHATGIVIGETAVVEDDVSILQDVTLGGTGKESDDRHPKIRTGVMIGAGAKILGNIEIGEGAKIAAGSVVLNSVPAHTTVAGVPAKRVGTPSTDRPSFDMDQKLSGGSFIDGDGI